MQIAIDGPAGAGKSTIARALADRLHYRYLDTGAMYRGIGYAALKDGVNVRSSEEVARWLPHMKMEVLYDEDRNQHVVINGRDVTDKLRTEAIGLAASDVATLLPVRDYLLDLQRTVAASSDIVMDGRDIGSHVLPDAEFKFFLTATVRARAQRRRRDLERAGRPCQLEEVEAEIRRRDEQDTTREYSPLTHTPGEILIDTSDLNEQEVLATIVSVLHGEESKAPS